MRTFVPGGSMPTIGGRSALVATARPLTETITSPISTPAFSAALPGSTLFTSAPSLLARPRALAWPASTGWITTPSMPRLTLPLVLICSAALMARSIGMAKLTPM